MREMVNSMESREVSKFPGPVSGGNVLVDFRDVLERRAEGWTVVEAEKECET